MRNGLWSRDTIKSCYYKGLGHSGRDEAGHHRNPIENTVKDLKTLMDLTVPGYLGTNEAFHTRCIGEEDELLPLRGRELSRRIAPFVLRRLKKTVIDELPEKIENIRTCPLSEDQVKLYRDAVDRKGRNLLSALNNDKAPAPYIHIFALLTLLKQICDHPALVDASVKEPDDYLQFHLTNNRVADHGHFSAIKSPC